MNLDEKKSIGFKITIAFLVAVVALVFFSRTIYEYNLPAVMVDFPKSGVIVNSDKAEGIVVLDDKKEIISDADGKIELNVEEGDHIEEGEIIFTIKSDIKSDIDNLENELESLKHNKELLQLENNKIDNDIKFNNEDIIENNEDIIENNTEQSLDLNIYDIELRRIEKNIDSNEKELEANMILFNNGLISENDINEIKEYIADLELQYDKVVAEKNKAIEDHNKSIEDHNKSIEDTRKLEDDKKREEEREKEREKEKAIADLQQARNENLLRISFIDKQISLITSQLDNNGVFVKYADFSGLVVDIFENAKTGRYVDKNTVVLSVQPDNSAYKAVFSIDDELDYIAVGDGVKLNIKIKNIKNLGAEISDIYFDEGKFKIDVVFEAENIKGGERVECYFEKVSELYETILPNTAIYEDNLMSYILYAEKVKNAYGYDYVARKVNVDIIDRDPINTAVYISSQNKALSVIINSNMPIGEDERVKIAGGSDLIEHR